MLHLKEIGIGAAALSAIIGGSITIASENTKTKLDKYVASVDLNSLPGNFIEIDNYEPVGYHINELVFKQEFAGYMGTFYKKVKYSYKIKNEDVKVTFKYKGKSRSKVYHLQVND